MPVEESAVDPSSASDGGSADRLTVGRCLVEDRDDALASAHRVVTAAVEHRPGRTWCVAREWISWESCAGLRWWVWW